MRQLVVYHRTGILAIHSPRLGRNGPNQKQPDERAFAALPSGSFYCSDRILQVLAHLCLFVEAVFDRGISSQDIDDLFESPLLQCTDGD